MRLTRTVEGTRLFVLNGLLNGKSGEYARKSDDTLMKDGWYWLIDGMTDGVGPYGSEDSMEDGFQREVDNAVQGLDGEGPYDP